MDEEILKEVWKIRFDKILKLKVESVELYEMLLKKYLGLLEEVGAKEVLEEIIADEKKHVTLAKELRGYANELLLPKK